MLGVVICGTGPTAADAEPALGDESLAGLAWLVAAVLSVGDGVGVPVSGGLLLVGFAEGEVEVGLGEVLVVVDCDGDGLADALGDGEPALQLGDPLGEEVPLWLTGVPLPLTVPVLPDDGALVLDPPPVK
ncbi:MAG: hypothetical protein ACTHKL_21825 [Streptosporangiaceae bacterium]